MRRLLADSDTPCEGSQADRQRTWSRQKRTNKLYLHLSEDSQTSSITTRIHASSGVCSEETLKQRANAGIMSARLMEPHVRDTRHTKAPGRIRAQGAVRTFSLPRAWGNANCWKQGGQIPSMERSVYSLQAFRYDTSLRQYAFQLCHAATRL